MHFDFDWVVETMNRQEANPFVGIFEGSNLGIIPAFHGVNSGEAIFDLLDRMPKNWKRQFLESDSFARGDAMRCTPLFPTDNSEIFKKVLEMNPIGLIGEIFPR